MSTYDAVVVGGGVMGFSAALELAKAGQKTVLLEQFPHFHTRGSSHGQTRITRSANYGTPEMTSIMVAGLAGWKKLQSEFGKQLLIPHPLMCIGNGGEEVKMMRKSIMTAGNSPDCMTVDEMNKTYGYNFPPDTELCSDPEGGVLMADRCVVALKTLFQRYGGTVIDEYPVSRVRVVGSKVVVHGPDGIITADRAVICAGAWTGPLMRSFGLNLPLTPLRVGVYYWKMKVPDAKTLNFMARVSGQSFDFYGGLPSIEYPGLLKIFAHTGLPCDPDCRDQTSMQPILPVITEFVEKFFPCLYPDPAIVESCMYTETPDEEMILDHPQGCPNIAYGCGFSGTGFKIAPTVGRLLCQMVTGEQLDHDITRFAADRFLVSKY